MIPFIIINEGLFVNFFNGSSIERDLLIKVSFKVLRIIGLIKINQAPIKKEGATIVPPCYKVLVYLSLKTKESAPLSGRMPSTRSERQKITSFCNRTM